MPSKPKRFKPAWAVRTANADYERTRESGWKRYTNRPGWESIRRAVFLRDAYRCQSCGVLVGQRPRDAQCDHIVPRDKGGSDEMSNLQTLCQRCHQAKTVRGE